MRFLVLPALCSLLWAASSGAEAGMRKPQLPVQVTIGPTQAGVTPESIRPGDLVEIAVTATAMTEVTGMRIDAVLSGGAGLVSGDLHWAGTAARGETKRITMTVRAPDKGAGRIRASITLSRNGKQVLKRTAQYVLGADEEQKRRKPAYQLKKDGTGRDIIEY
jgi:hypothetical protein